MKLKDFLFSTLPRSRKSKRKQSKNAEPSGSASSPETDDVIIRNNKAQSDIINANGKSVKKKKNRSQSAASSAPAQGYTGTPNPGVSVNYNLVSSDFYYFSDGNCNQYCNPCGYNTLAKTPSNASESGFEDSHDPYVPCNYHTGFQPSSPDSNSNQDIVTNTFNTFPRERTRIKTNPWVTKHSDTMTSSIHGQVTDSTFTRVKSPYSVAPSSSYGSTSFIEYNNGNPSDMYYSHSDGYPGTSDSGSSIAPDSSVPASPITGHVTYNGTLTSRNGDPYKRKGVLEGGDLVINLNTGDIFVKHNEPDFSPISFQYEEDLDATLERDTSRRKAKSRRRRDECYYLTQEDLNTNLERLSRESDGSGDEYVMDLTGHLVGEEDDRDGTLTRDSSQWSYQPCNSQSLRKRGVKPRKTRMEARLRQDSTANTMYSPYKEMQYGATGICRSPSKCCYTDDIVESGYHLREGTDSAYDSSTLSSLAGSSFQGHRSTDALDISKQTHQTLPGVRYRKPRIRKESPNRRSLEEIHMSLKEKVGRLKAEKRIVDEKVQQARQEEELRREEKARIDQEVTSIRKQVLLQTLHDLRENLQDQSQRLQEAYDDVLDMQWVNAKLRRLRNTTM